MSPLAKPRFAHTCSGTFAVAALIREFSKPFTELLLKLESNEPWDEDQEFTDYDDLEDGQPLNQIL